MSNSNASDLQNKTALITGASRRIGAVIARTLHSAGMNITLHYRGAKEQADALCDELNQLRDNSCIALRLDLHQTAQLPELIEQSQQHWGRLDLLVNNASSFYPTHAGKITEQHWDDLIGSNLKAPLFLSQAAIPALKASQGCIVNIVDIHAERPMKNHTLYCAAKAGLAMLTKSLAKELGPEIRVNGVAPGAIMWPESELDAETQNEILSRTALKRSGMPEDIAAAVLFLSRDAHYITGQIIPVDGGRSLNI
ncbi:MAG: pteridine reductase [Gammaproteobacteria bacterium]|nr:pteridine reductase [Gammaproteobacteria bacterium]